jgi:homospermidine synthase
MSAIVWMIENPDRGVVVADDMDHERILELAKPYLGTYYSEPVDWTPLDNRNENELFTRFNRPAIRLHDEDETWQFTTFLL